MKKEKIYDEEYCVRLIKSALLPGGENPRINACSIKRRILDKVNYLQERYGIDHDDLFSKISLHFLERRVIEKFDPEIAGPTTFILHYVLKQLENIQKSCVLGTFHKTSKKPDAMDLVDFHLEEVPEDRTWLKEAVDYRDPESLLIAKETQERLLYGLGDHEQALLMGAITIEEYCKLTGVSSRTAYRRLADIQLEVEELDVVV